MTHIVRQHCCRTILALLLTVPLVARGQGSSGEKELTILDKLKALHLPYTAGTVPAYYSPGFEARSLKYQRTLIACQQWYDQQMGKHADFTLAVLNKADWERVSYVDYLYPVPYSLSLGDPIVVLPGRFEDYPNSAEFTDDVELLVENIAYHELGHIYAHAIDMDRDDNLLAELYANLFMVSFVRAHRPDMVPFLQGPPAKLPPQRYTSAEDMQYLGGDGGMTNYGWFQFQPYRMSDLMLQGTTLPKLLAELKNVFKDPTPRPFSYVAAELEGVHPGLAAAMGSFWKPTTLPEVKPKPCIEAIGSKKDSALVVQNASSKSVTLTVEKQQPVTVAPNSWATVNGHAGERVQADGGLCFFLADEPAIARLSAK